MPSPFPGMNPYLEQDGLWPDVHHRLISEIATQLAAKVQPDFFVNIGQDVYLRIADSAERDLFGKPDVAIAELRRSTSGVSKAALATPAGIPGVIDLPVIKDELGMIEIQERDSERVVTVIELLSPSNKYAGRDYEQYLAKRIGYLSSGAHFIEIDLLRGGPRMPCEGMPLCDYVVLLSRTEHRPNVELFPFGVRQEIPPVPVPLNDSHADVMLDLHDAIDTVYDEALYGLRIYRRQPRPLLKPADREWAAELIQRDSRRK
jgi:hypothetical protein